MSSLVRLYEMARPAGALGASTRAALEMARQFGKDFDVDDFIGWMEQNGNQGIIKANANGYLRRLTADTDNGESPSALKPLVVTSKGARGRGSIKTTYRYVFDGAAGTQRPAPGAPKARKAAQPDPDFDEDEAELAAMGFTKIPAAQGSEDDEEPPEGEFSSSDDEDWDDEGTPEPAGDGGRTRNWVPQPDAMGSYAESSMEKLSDKGFGPESDLWDRIAKTSGDIEAHALIRKELPITLQRPALAVAKQIFQNLAKDWEGGKRESRLLRLYRMDEAPCGDEDVPSPERRGTVSVGRTLPDYGMDEAQLDPVDFAQLHGIRVRR